MAGGGAKGREKTRKKVRELGAGERQADQTGPERRTERQRNQQASRMDRETDTQCPDRSEQCGPRVRRRPRRLGWRKGVGRKTR